MLNPRFPNSIANSQILAQLFCNANAISMRQRANPLENIGLFNDGQFAGTHDRRRWQARSPQVFNGNVAIVGRVGSAGAMASTYLPLRRLKTSVDTTTAGRTLLAW